jgi:SAM-dependent methyltransferase
MVSPVPDPFGPQGYGDSFADVYDDWYGAVSDVAATVAGLVRLGGAGPLLELGVGTGRIARALAAAEVPVVGVDASAAMLARLPRAERILVVQADMAALPLRPACGFRGAFAAFNTLFNLTTEAAQRACLAAVAAVLAPGGWLAVEAFVPGDPSGPPGALEVSRVEADRVVLLASRTDRASQVVTGQHVDITEGGIRLRPWRIRYASPDQLDEMAASARLVLAERWGDWTGVSFDPAGPAHVSIYRKAPE